MLDHILRTVQVDVGRRGLANDPVENLITATLGDFEAACRSVAEHPNPRVGIITGFMIPSVSPPTGETDGPPGSLFLAEMLDKIGIPVVLASDAAGYAALTIGVKHRGMPHVPVIDLRTQDFLAEAGALTHLIALERSGPTVAGTNHTMRGRDITAMTFPAHQFFEGPRDYVTIGIGDGGNEIGMGKIPRSVIEKNIPNGGQVACRTAADHLIVCGISNWGGIALAAGTMWLRGVRRPELFNPDTEQKLLQTLVTEAPLVDGVAGAFTATVDGIPFDRYAEPIREIRDLFARSTAG
ncbi:glutamate cyclase domain-containing protein [Zavarzinella formosa]|uniref:glutamate cyclase domain-containing protein n=1 Tax=Zavarzinella formosa TaxID=360055 RepID=UPI0002D98FF1|nr:glutamate cyclase domain-containing protein [Zavarzinella formosa]